jgi:hypothetical protein
MIEIIPRYAQCDECRTHLSYDKDDLELSWNAFHTRRNWYLECPVCGNDICIEEYKEKHNGKGNNKNNQA